MQWMRVLVLLAMVVSFSSPAAVLIDDNDDGKGESTYKIANNGLRLRGLRRAGVGIMAGGLSGIAGLNLEINFTETVGFNAGFGTSTDFNSIFAGFKHVFGGSWFLPYASFGYARWYAPNVRGQLGETTPGFLRKRFLSPSEIATGKFDENILFAGVGLQYLQLNGDWAGASVYFEGLFLANLGGLRTSPTAGLGMMYYF